MKFHITQTIITDNTCTAEVWFKSSKEKFKLGTLTFVDTDKDVRDDVLKLLQVALSQNPLFQV